DDMVDRLELIEQASGSIPLVHIEDVCRAEIFAAEEATSGRYIVCTLNTSGVALAHFLAAKYPQYEINTDQYVVYTTFYVLYKATGCAMHC
uniref:NAD-dependent epimerase/dehydratase domain-containing protein n=1 Tax=Aegilops tauschii subsp. strangulata TaxID=200361 RepID=A0A453D2W2_AEGTS